MPEIIYKNGCWGCARALEAENPEQYICPKLEQHKEDYYKILLREFW